MMSRALFSPADLAALNEIAKLASSAGLAVRWDDTHRLEARAPRLASISARGSPAREHDGVTVTAIDAAGERRFFDGPADQFTPAGVNLHKLHCWLVESLSRP
jgi:hypothetical protein